MFLLQALTVGLVALILAPGCFFYFDVTPKVVVLLVGVAGLLLFAARDRTSPRGPRRFTLLLWLYAGSLALSTALSSNRAISLYGSSWRSFGAIVQCALLLFAGLVGWQCTGRPERVRALLRTLALTGILSAAYGIAQYFGWDPFLPKAAYHVGDGVWQIVRPPGTLGYASYFATWLLITVFLSLALAQRESQTIWRTLAYSAAALSFAAMLMTGTRAALLGLAAGAIVWCLASGFRVPRRVLAVVTLLLVAAAAFYFSPPGQQLRSRSRWFAEDPWGGARPLLWRDSLRMTIQHLVAGYGPETFFAEFPHHQSRTLAQRFPDFVHESPHNILLDALVSQGLPGFLILGALCVAGFTAAWRLKLPLLAAALSAAFVSQQFTAFTVPTALLFLVTLALIAAAEPDRPAAPASLLFSSAAPLLALAFLYVALRLAMADHALAETQRLLHAADYRAATAEYETYWFWHLPGPNADLWYSRTWMEIAAQTQDMGVLEQAFTIAEQAGERSIATAEEPFAAWYNLAQIRAQRDDYDGTEASLRQAIAAHPNWFKPHWMLAREFRLVSKLDQAEAEARLAVELDGGKHPEVSQTLFDILARR